MRVPLFGSSLCPQGAAQCFGVFWMACLDACVQGGSLAQTYRSL